jgi:MFS family permease
MFAVFFLHALSQGGIFSRIPDIQQRLGLSEAELGLALLGQPIGAILTFLVASHVIERLGTRSVILAAIPGMAALIFCVAVAPSAPAMAAFLAAYGALFAISNIAINVEADRIEAAGGQRIMNTCHGIWSVGLLTASLIGTLMRGLAIAPGPHFALIVPVTALGIAVFASPTQSAPPRPHSAAAARFRVALPTGMTLLLVGYVAASSLLEGGLRNWSVIFMRDSFSAPAWVDTLTLPAFLTAQSIGRLLADRAVARWGAVALARSLALTALLGLLLVIFSPTLVVALMGFTLIGAGVCVAFPLSTSAAAQLGDRPSSENVAALTMSQQILLLGTPALLGAIATAWGIRATYAVMVPPILLAAYLARYLAPRRPAAAPA